VLAQIFLPRHALHAILSIQEVVCSTAGIEHGRGGIQLLEAMSRFLATRAIAAGGQNWPADSFQFHLAASAYRRQLFLLFLVHGDYPFVGPVYISILMIARRAINMDRFGSRPLINAVTAAAVCHVYSAG
jgi:hypothetical protein